MTTVFAERTQCTGKVKYPSKQLAVKDNRRRQVHKGHDILKAYRCSHCGSWHLGHRPSAAALAVARGGIPERLFNGLVMVVYDEWMAELRKVGAP